MHPDSTFELRIEFSQKQESAVVKDSVKEFLSQAGEPSFVEGYVDGLDLDFDYGEVERDYYNELGGAVSPLSLYKYDRSRIDEIREALEGCFGNSLRCEVLESETSDWMEGWKESFQPFSTKKFYVYPPWLNSSESKGLLAIEIEPGMAFGTGQHATTQLCLSEIETLWDERSIGSALDVGTGTGILSIALAKLGCQNIFATDIDSDAVIATKDNAKVNGVEMSVVKDSVPSEGQYDLVIANILFVVIKTILPQLSERMAPGGVLLLSGVLSEEYSELEDLAKSCDLMIKRKQEMDGWISLSLGK